MNKYLQNLIQISHTIGTDTEYIQGGGGNTSAKDDDGKIYIKASGTKLGDMSETNGYATINLVDVKDAITAIQKQENNLDTENQLSKTMASLVEEEGIRPSMELSFHVSLKRYIVHTHPIHTNIITCLQGGEELLKKILEPTMGSFLWIQYKNPGYNLGLAIQEAYERNPQDSIFLQNHGLITTSDDSQEALNKTLQINDIISEYLSKNFNIPTSIDMDEPIENKEKVLFSNHPLIAKYTENIENLQEQLTQAFFPDFIVYAQRNIIFQEAKNLEDTLSTDKPKMVFVKNEGVYYTGAPKYISAMHQTLIATLFILDGIQKIGSPEHISKQDADYILGMDNEKYRQKLVS